MSEEKISKHKKYGFVYGIKGKTPVGRIAWPSLVTAKESTFPVKEGDTPPPPRFEVTLLFSKKDKEVKSFLKTLDAQATDMEALFNEGKKTKITISEVLKDGDEMDHEKYPYYEGHYYMTAKHAERPQIFDKDVNTVEPADVKGGMQALAVIRPICTAHGISYQLLVLQLAKDDGVRFAGGQTDAKDMLDALSNGDDEDEDEIEEEESEDEEEDEIELPKPKVKASVSANAKSKSKPSKELNLNKLG